jgi:hypothetical protein
MDYRLTHRCGKENKVYRHGKLGIFTGKIKPQLTKERKCWVSSGKRMEIKMQSHNVAFGE